MQSWTNVETSLLPPAGRAVPGRVEELRAEWLTECLRHAQAIAEGARIASFESTRIGEGHGFAGQIARLQLRYEPADAGPRTLIAKFVTEHAPTREMISAVDGYVREVRFYRELAPDVGVPTPRCYLAHYDRAAGRFLLLLEDLAPASPVDIAVGLSVPQAELVLEHLAAMHARWWNRVEELPWLALTPELIATIRERFHAALPGFLQHRAASHPTLARVARRIAVIMADDQFVREVRRPPLTLAHNDIHLNNIFLPGEQGGRLALIDWQSVTASRHGITDVARLLSVGLTPELRRRHGRALLRHYHRRLCALGVRGYGRLLMKYRFRQELVAIVIIVVLAFDTLDFGGAGGQRTAELMGARIESAVADAHVIPLLELFAVWFGLRRWLRRWGVRLRLIGPG